MADVDKRGWTIETLKAFMDERHAHYSEKSELQKEAVANAFNAAAKAVAVAEENAEKWRMNANEWRSAMNDRERQFLSKGMGYVVGALSAIALILTIMDRMLK
jgi:hypothetical protein